MPQLRIITEKERKGQRAELNSVKFNCANPLSSRSEVTFFDLGGNLHNVQKPVSYLHIVVLALEWSIFKEHFKIYAKKGCPWTSVIPYAFWTHIKGLLNIWFAYNTAYMPMINFFNSYHRQIIKHKFRRNRNHLRNHLNVWGQVVFWCKVVLYNYALPTSCLLEELFQKAQECISQSYFNSVYVCFSSTTYCFLCVHVDSAKNQDD